MSFAFMKTLDNLSYFVHLNHKYDMHKKNLFVFFDFVELPM
jgi:hypothetical protein